jgi:hypothetical protein
LLALIACAFTAALPASVVAGVVVVSTIEELTAVLETRLELLMEEVTTEDVDAVLVILTRRLVEVEVMVTIVALAVELLIPVADAPANSELRDASYRR